MIKNLKKRNSNIYVISYSEILAEYVSQKLNSTVTKNILREKSSKIITEKDIEIVDQEILQLVKRFEKEKHIIIDSHAVTFEEYGIRVTPFSNKIIKLFDFDMYIALYTDVDIIYKRIVENPEGRKIVSQADIQNAINVQSALLLNYCSISDKPAYFLNTKLEMEYLVEWLSAKLNN